MTTSVWHTRRSKATSLTNAQMWHLGLWFSRVTLVRGGWLDWSWRPFPTLVILWIYETQITTKDKKFFQSPVNEPSVCPMRGHPWSSDRQRDGIWTTKDFLSMYWKWAAQCCAGQPTHAAFWTENEQCFTAPSSTLKCVTVLKLSQMSSLLLYSWHCTIILNNSELFHCLCLFFMSTHGSHKSKSELHLSKDIQCIKPLQKGNQIKACKPVKQFVLALVVASDASWVNPTVRTLWHLTKEGFSPYYYHFFVLSLLLQQNYSSRNQSWCDTSGLGLWGKAWTMRGNKESQISDMCSTAPHKETRTDVLRSFIKYTSTAIL